MNYLRCPVMNVNSIATNEAVLRWEVEMAKKKAVLLLSYPEA